MSSELGMQFGQEFGSDYGDVLESWSPKVQGVSDVSDKLQSDWGADLRDALGDSLTGALVSGVFGLWAASKLKALLDTVKMFASIAVKVSLVAATIDLLRRFVRIANNPDEKLAISIPELIKRAPQTVAQIFDMARDKFNQILGRFFKRKEELTGRRRWQTVETHEHRRSRHAALDGEIKTEGDDYHLGGEAFYGPRPPNGSPALWSNCSCYLEFEREDGKWITV